MCKFAISLFTLLIASSISAHDTWVETNLALVRVGDRVDIDLKLGNHGNEHRDFKLASKVAPDSVTLEVLSPAGKRYDLKPALADLGRATEWTGVGIDDAVDRIESTFRQFTGLIDGAAQPA